MHGNRLDLLAGVAVRPEPGQALVGFVGLVEGRVGAVADVADRTLEPVHLGAQTSDAVGVLDDPGILLLTLRVRPVELVVDLDLFLAECLAQPLLGCAAGGESDESDENDDPSANVSHESPLMNGGRAGSASFAP